MAAKTFTQKILHVGSQAAYEASDQATIGLYFTTDTLKLYKGSVDYSQAVRTVSTYPTAGTAANNILYVQVASGKAVSAKYTTDKGTNWVTVALSALESTQESPVGADLVGDNTSYPTTKTMVDYVVAKVGTSGAVTNIGADTTTAGRIHYAVAGSTQTTNVDVPGIVYNPVWNATTQTLTMQVAAIGETAAREVEVNIAQNLVLKSGRYDSASQKIILVLNDPEETEIEIDVSDLIDEIAGGTTNTAVTNYDTATNVLTADVRVSALAGNGLSIVTGDGTSANNGLYVDLSDIETSIDNLYNALSAWVVLTEPVTP